MENSFLNKLETNISLIGLSDINLIYDFIVSKRVEGQYAYE